MFDIANNTVFLTAIGIADASEDVKTKIIAGIEHLAEERLIIRLSDQVTEEQIEEFNKITDEQEAFEWLKTNIPDFEKTANDVLSEIQYEILKNKVEVVGA